MGVVRRVLGGCRRGAGLGLCHQVASIVSRPFRCRSGAVLAADQHNTTVRPRVKGRSGLQDPPVGADRPLRHPLGHPGRSVAESRGLLAEPPAAGAEGARRRGLTSAPTVLGPGASRVSRAPRGDGSGCGGAWLRNGSLELN
ncbi:hypothetical protein SL003B_2133 [Polymorphum gilvum SL003B-26A1]|uniref:Uncharacterized protein n=1 Tax=Polymorphum gilvum (strain LMG 25793 / CGMCC 1.9160 / SL003B-26A1) TaxID=991905 RepID=F2IYU3_POLGS|nr:hypothetical protein SL003B_2133 [Polymorphum gilvum SL003B-26A1]